MPLGRAGRLEAMERQEAHDFGPVCLGAPRIGIPGCGKPRSTVRRGARGLERRVVDPRLKWCCEACGAKGER